MFGWFGNSENKDDVIPDDQLPTALTCEKVTDESKAHVCDWDFFKDKKSIHWLNKGCLVLFFFFTSSPSILTLSCENWTRGHLVCIQVRGWRHTVKRGPARGREGGQRVVI